LNSLDWVRDHYLELQKQYSNMFIAVKGTEIIAYGKTLSNVLKNTRNIECTIEFIQSRELFAYKAGEEM